MKTFNDLVFEAHPDIGTGGVRSKLFFANGRGISVIRGPYSYGGDKGLYEVGALDSTGDLDYKTPVGEDVIGHLSPGEVTAIMNVIEGLPVCEALQDEENLQDEEA